jgi:hypothetical protein
MKYSELKSRVKILKKHAYLKDVGQPYYQREYTLNKWRIKQSISNFDVIYCHYPLDEFLQYLYEKNMRILLEYDLENYCNLQKNKV